ncbi:MAG: DUF72 domain-containing protein [Acidobacteriota bacterium]
MGGVESSGVPILTGTSGFAYEEWKGSFYPRELRSSAWLSWYASALDTTEINLTFYRMPSTRITARWAEEVPPHFRFSIKLNRRITHQKKLEDVDSEMEYFQQGIAPVRDRLAAVLVQLPPWAGSRLEVLGKFLSEYAGRLPLAFEFRHQGWDTEETASLIENHGGAIVLAETDDHSPVRRSSARFLYLRLRRSTYADEELKDWADWLRDAGRPAYVYFKHDTEAPSLALRFRRLLGEAGSGGG